MSLFKKKKNKNVTSREEINAELETESLKKSHSSWSNFLLTILSIVTILGVSAFWLTLGYMKEMKLLTFILSIIASLVIVSLSMVCFKNFKR